MAPRDCRPTEMPPATVAFAKARNLGRAMRVVFRVGGRVALVVYNVYGFPGGHHCREAAARTNAIVEAVIQEATQRGDLYVAIVGDLNADAADLPAITELLQGHGWTDLGAHPRWLAGRPPPRLPASLPDMLAPGGTTSLWTLTSSPWTSTFRCPGKTPSQSTGPSGWTLDT